MTRHQLGLLSEAESAIKRLDEAPSATLLDIAIGLLARAFNQGAMSMDQMLDGARRARGAYKKRHTSPLYG